MSTIGLWSYHLCSSTVSHWIVRKWHLDTAATTVTVWSGQKWNWALFRDTVSCSGSHSSGRSAVFHLEHFNPSLLGWWHHLAQFTSKGWNVSARSVVEAQRVWEKKRHFEVKKSSLGLEFIRFWRDSARNKGKEWEFFFLLCYATTWALFLSLSLSLFTSSVLIGPHPLTQDSLLFWSSVISCNVLNLDSPSKSSASLQLCLFLYLHIS